MDMQQIVENAPRDNHLTEWRPMSQRPERAARVEVLSTDGDAHTFFSAYEDGIFYGCGPSSCDFTSLRRYGIAGWVETNGKGWRYADEQAPATDATQADRIAEAMMDHGELPDPITASDRRGIETFTPPPEVKREPEQVRVSSLRRWAWLEQFR